MELNLLNDFLGRAAKKKQLAKQAIKDKKFDDAWKYLHEQKILYLQHANRPDSGFDHLSTMVVDASIHEDLANILRLENKHKDALLNISYVYKVNFTAKRPRITLEKKLKVYFGRVGDSADYSKFKRMLESLKNYDYLTIRGFIDSFFSQN